MAKPPTPQRPERLKVARQNASIRGVSSGKNIECMLLDVSANGLGLATFQNILPDTQVVLTVGGKDILLTLMWCHILERQRSGFRYGFRCIDPRINLSELLIAHGMVNVNLLLVEDDADVAELYATFLEGKGFNVEIATSGAAAVSAMDKKPFDVVVTDMVMPDGDGLTVVREAQTQKIPVAILTGHAEACAAVAGAVPVVDKMALDPKGLPGLVASLLKTAS